jgi:hypothetical protein
MAKMISAKSAVVSRNGSASERIPAPAHWHLARDHQQVGRVARKPVNRRGDDNIAGREDLHQFGRLRRVDHDADDLLAEDFFASNRLELAHLSGFVLARDAFMTSLPRWLMTLTAMRPDLG